MLRQIKREEADKRRLDAWAAKHHHMLSTHVLPGIYNSPYLPWVQPYPPHAEHTRAARHLQLPVPTVSTALPHHMLSTHGLPGIYNSPYLPWVPPYPPHAEHTRAARHLQLLLPVVSTALPTTCWAHTCCPASTTPHIYREYRLSHHMLSTHVLPGIYNSPYLPWVQPYPPHAEHTRAARHLQLPISTDEYSLTHHMLSTHVLPGIYNSPYLPWVQPYPPHAEHTRAARHLQLPVPTVSTVLPTTCWAHTCCPASTTPRTYREYSLTHHMLSTHVLPGIYNSPYLPWVQPYPAHAEHTRAARHLQLPVSTVSTALPITCWANTCVPASTTPRTYREYSLTHHMLSTHVLPGIYNSSYLPWVEPYPPHAEHTRAARHLQLPVPTVSTALPTTCWAHTCCPASTTPRIYREYSLTHHMLSTHVLPGIHNSPYLPWVPPYPPHAEHTRAARHLQLPVPTVSTALPTTCWAHTCCPASTTPRTYREYRLTHHMLSTHLAARHLQLPISTVSTALPTTCWAHTCCPASTTPRTYREYRLTHHILSTHVLPGIYNSPYLPWVPPYPPHAEHTRAARHLQLLVPTVSTALPTTCWAHTCFPASTTPRTYREYRLTHHMLSTHVLPGIYNSPYLPWVPPYPPHAEHTRVSRHLQLLIPTVSTALPTTCWAHTCFPASTTPRTYREYRLTHHMLSTHVLPGIYNSPYLPWVPPYPPHAEHTPCFPASTTPRTYREYRLTHHMLSTHVLPGTYNSPYLPWVPPYPPHTELTRAARLLKLPLPTMGVLK